MASTNLGTLGIYSDSPEDVVFRLNIENNDNAMVADASNLKWLATADGVNAVDFTDIVGQDLTLAEFAQVIEEMLGIFDIDAEKIGNIMFNMIDSGQCNFSYRIDIALIYESEEPDSYKEAVINSGSKTE